MNREPASVDALWSMVDSLRVEIAVLATERNSALVEALGVSVSLRREWWANHGIDCLPYGDDGEMQCCGLDFLRAPLAQLKQDVDRLRTARTVAAVRKDYTRSGYTAALAEIPRPGTNVNG